MAVGAQGAAPPMMIFVDGGGLGLLARRWVAPGG